MLPRVAFLAPALALSIVTSAHAAPVPARPSPMVQPWGLSLDYIDRSLPPGADFFTYANNGWLKTATIPPDRPAVGAFSDISIRNDERLKAIFADLHTRTNLTPEEVKIRDLYEA